VRNECPGGYEPLAARGSSPPQILLRPPPREQRFLDLLWRRLGVAVHDDGHAGTVGAGQLDDGGVEQGIVRLQFVHDPQRKLAAKLVRVRLILAIGRDVRDGDGVASVEDEASGAGGPPEMRLDLDQGLGHAVARLAGFEVLHAALGDAGERGEGLLREPSGFAGRSDGDCEPWPLQLGPVLCHGLHDAPRLGNTHPLNPLIDQD
jgi:hypothetical protein